jgi:hypothetical protein
MGLNDWVAVSAFTYISPSSGLVHDCNPLTCQSWVLRFVDGVKICAISGKLLMVANPATTSSRKRCSTEDSGSKRHQDKAIPGSSAYLTEKYNLDQNSFYMESFPTAVSSAPRMNQYPWSGTM